MSTQGATPDDDQFNDAAYLNFSYQYRKVFIVIVLLGSLHGVLTILSIISCYTLLMRRHHHKSIRPTAILLCLTILVLFTSTTIYLVIYIVYYHAQLTMDLFDFAAMMVPQCFENLDPTVPPVVLASIDLLFQQASIQGCAAASTLTVNVILGDAIVCWRACVVWHKNHVVKASCAVFLLATFILGVVDSRQSCRYFVPYPASGGTNDNVPGGLFEGVPVGIATCVLSLSTNVLATLLVAYKSWQSRRRLKGYFLIKVGGSQVEKFLSLLIESGIIYCTIWSVVVAFQVSRYTLLNEYFFEVTSDFLVYFGIIMNGALVPIIAIYPAVIIVILALNKSHMERAISQHLESIPTPHIAITGDTETINLDEIRTHRRRRTLVFDRQESGCEDGREDTRNYVSEEREAEA